MTFERVRRKERKTEHLSVPMTVANLVRLSAEAKHRGVSKTELARTFILTGLETP